jgi:hypothetical protein
MVHRAGSAEIHNCQRVVGPYAAGCAACLRGVAERRSARWRAWAENARYRAALRAAAVTEFVGRRVRVSAQGGVSRSKRLGLGARCKAG